MSFLSLLSNLRNIVGNDANPALTVTQDGPGPLLELISAGEQKLYVDQYGIALSQFGEIGVLHAANAYYSLISVNIVAPYITMQNGVLVLPASPSQIPLSVQGRAGQTGDLLQALNSLAAVLAGVTTAGEVYGSGFAGALRSVSAATSFTTADDTILASAASAAFAVTLPAAASVKSGREFSLKKMDNSANAVTLTTNGTDTIEGAVSVALTTQYSYRTVRSDGVSQWLICGGSLT